MTMNQRSIMTTKNIQEKANLIWDIANHISGIFKPHEYGKVILPMTVLKRFDDILKETKQEVLKLNNKLKETKTIDELKEGLLTKVTGHDFYNISPFTFESLLSDPDNLFENFDNYLKGFSDNIKDIIENFDFEKTLDKLDKSEALYIVVQEFNSKKADMHPDRITSADMGYIFEELIRKFSESYDEQAGAHFTARDIIYVMAELLIAPKREEIEQKGAVKTIYDMTMGTSQMLGCMDEKIKEINPNSKLSLFGQELNPETYAIAKADMLIKGGNAQNMKFGDTLNNDQFPDYEFDYIISNPPFGINWKRQQSHIRNEHKILGYNGRFGPGLPAVSDGQMLFLLNGVKKLKENSGRMAIIQNGSSLFTGDAGSGPSEIRRYLIENDMLEAIVQLPKDLFYNTGISTYIWLITKNKSKERLNKVQLIDASKCYKMRRKNIGKKRVDLDDSSIELILKAYNENKNKIYSEDNLIVESKVFDKKFYGYLKVTIEAPILDENNNPKMNRNRKQIDVSRRDTENIPLLEDVNEYFENYIKPFNKFAWIDRKKDKIGYEISFTKVFYRLEEPDKSSEVSEKITELNSLETKLIKELF